MNNSNITNSTVDSKYCTPTLTVRGDNNFAVSACGDVTINCTNYFSLTDTEIFESAFKQGFETALRLLTNFN